MVIPNRDGADRRAAPRRRARGRSRGFALLEVAIAGTILAVGLAVVIGLAVRAVDMHNRGERRIVAAMLLDELLSSVLTEGPQDFPDLHPMFGACDEPFDDWGYEVRIEDAEGQLPFGVTVTVTDPTGASYVAETMIAPKLGEEPDPERAPFEPIDREGRYIEESLDE